MVGGTQLTIPPPLLARANAEFDRERERREKEIALAKAQALGDARARGKFARALEDDLAQGSKMTAMTNAARAAGETP